MQILTYANLISSFGLLTAALGRYPLCNDLHELPSHLQSRAEAALHDLTEAPDVDDKALSRARARFDDLYAQALRRGLPSLSLDAYKWRLLEGAKEPSRFVDEVGVLPDAVLIKAVLELSYPSVPDVYMNHLLRRFEKTQDDQLAQVLITLANIAPERFSSELGVLIYLNLFEQSAPEEQATKISMLLQKAKKDVRAYPVFWGVLPKVIPVLRAEHLTNLFTVLAQYEGSTSDVGDDVARQLQEQRPDLCEACVAAIFTEAGQLVLRINTERFFYALPQEQRQNLLQSWLHSIQTQETQGWKELALINHYGPAVVCSEDSDIEVWSYFRERFVQVSQDRLSGFSTAMLVKILLYHEINGNQQAAEKIFEYITRKRLTDLKQGQGLLLARFGFAHGIEGAEEYFKSGRTPEYFGQLMQN